MCCAWRALPAAVKVLARTSPDEFCNDTDHDPWLPSLTFVTIGPIVVLASNSLYMNITVRPDAVCGS